MTEIWKPVVGFEGAYEVSDHGRVRSLDRVVTHRLKGRILRPGIASNGYPTVAIGGKSRTVHSLALRAFDRAPLKGEVTRHLDGDRKHSTLTNLKYGTPTQNRADTDWHNRSPRGSGYRSARLNEQTAAEVRRLKGVVPQSELARRYGVSAAAIQAVHDGRTWKHV